jgi:hypothetical protein
MRCPLQRSLTALHGAGQGSHEPCRAPRQLGELGADTADPELDAAQWNAVPDSSDGDVVTCHASSAIAMTRRPAALGMKHLGCGVCHYETGSDQSELEVFNSDGDPASFEVEPAGPIGSLSKAMAKVPLGMRILPGRMRSRSYLMTTLSDPMPPEAVPSAFRPARTGIDRSR